MVSTLALAATLLAHPAGQSANGPFFFNHPTANATTICFGFAGDLWSVPREGGDAKRLTSSVGQESDPYYSPDGKWIAFTGQYAGKTDVYVMPAEGGVPKQLTFGPAGEDTLGWTPDGKRVLFSSTEGGLPFVPRLFTISTSGGEADDLPYPAGTMGSFSPDGKQIAYVPYMQFQAAWKRYRGGEAFPIWISKLEDSTWKEVPRRGWNDKQPNWVGNKIYYLSDRTGKFNLYSCDTSGGGQKEVAKSGAFDFSTATAGPGVIVLTEPGVPPFLSRFAETFPKSAPNTWKSAMESQAPTFPPTESAPCLNRAAKSSLFPRAKATRAT
jgi:tricorn protease